MGREVAPGLAPQAEPLNLQIINQIIQEGNNTQESHKSYNPPPPPFCTLTIWEVAKEVTEYQRKTTIWSMNVMALGLVSEGLLVST